jgi:hypothetical protein
MFIKPLQPIGLIIAFIPCVFWHLFRHLILGVSKKDIVKVTNLPNFNNGHFYVIWDKKAKYFWNKIFFAKVR